MRILITISLWKLRNALRTTLSDPRKWIPLLIFGGFLVLQTIGASMLWMRRLGPEEDIGRFLLENASSIDAAIFLTLALFSAGIIDAGFGGGSLVFPLADVDYLFPAPFRRRMLLALKLPGATARFLLVIALLLGLFRGFIAGPIALAASAATPNLAPASLGLLLYVGTYVNLAVAIELVFGLGRQPWLRRAILVLVGAVVLITGVVIWQMRGAGLEAIGHHPVLSFLFYPARLATNGLSATLTGATGYNELWKLAAFYIVTLLLLFSRKENFFETAAAGAERFALLRKAAREQNWSVLLGTQKGEASERSGAFAFPRFGQGAMALFWAHLTAAAKRPWVNFAAPVLGGFALSAMGFVLRDRDFNVLSLVIMGVAYYLFYAVLLLGVPFFRRSLQRYAFVRPLPLPVWQIVIADVAPRVIMSSLFVVACGLTLPLTGLRRSAHFGILMVLCLPVMLITLNLVQYIVAMWYPNPQDKVQTMVAGFLQLAVTGVISGILLAFFSLPTAFGAPVWTGVLTFWIATFATSALLLWVAVAVYRAYEPIGDTA